MLHTISLIVITLDDIFVIWGDLYELQTSTMPWSPVPYFASKNRLGIGAKKVLIKGRILEDKLYNIEQYAENVKKVWHE